MKKATIVLVLISNHAKEKDQIIQIDYSEIDKKRDIELENFGND